MPDHARRTTTDSRPSMGNGFHRLEQELDVEAIRLGLGEKPLDE